MLKQLWQDYRCISTYTTWFFFCLSAIYSMMKKKKKVWVATGANVVCPFDTRPKCLNATHCVCACFHTKMDVLTKEFQLDLIMQLLAIVQSASSPFVRTAERHLMAWATRDEENFVYREWWVLWHLLQQNELKPKWNTCDQKQLKFVSIAIRRFCGLEILPARWQLVDWAT